MKLRFTLLPALMGVVLLFGCSQNGVESEQPPTVQETASESEKMGATLIDSEELPVKERDCISMAQGSDAVYNLSISYDWQCETCGYCDSGHTIEGNRVIVCHGWTS